MVKAVLAAVPEVLAALRSAEARKIAEAFYKALNAGKEAHTEAIAERKRKREEAEREEARKKKAAAEAAEAKRRKEEEKKKKKEQDEEEKKRKKALAAVKVAFDAWEKGGTVTDRIEAVVKEVEDEMSLDVGQFNLVSGAFVEFCAGDADLTCIGGCGVRLARGEGSTTDGYPCRLRYWGEVSKEAFSGDRRR